MRIVNLNNKICCIYQVDYSSSYLVENLNVLRITKLGHSNSYQIFALCCLSDNSFCLSHTQSVKIDILQ